MHRSTRSERVCEAHHLLAAASSPPMRSTPRGSAVRAALRPLRAVERRGNAHMNHEKGDAVSGEPTIHRFPANHQGAFVNAYLVETDSGLVAVDGLLTVSAAREMRAAVDRLEKPLHSVLLTQSHPDHYAGLIEIVAGDDVPIVAPQGVIDTIAADDAMKDQIIGPMFGEDWPARRVFPNTPIRDGESLTFDDLRSEEHTSELQSLRHLVCRPLLEKKTQ